jgi:putative salt-induced outer membrane protein
MKRRIMVLLALPLLGAGLLEAQDQPKPVNFTGELGFVNTAGNTHLTTVNVGDKFTVKTGKVLLTQTFALVYGKNDGVETANSRVVRLRADLSVAAKLSSYGFVSYERNRFAGISYRTDEGVGISLAAIRSPRQELDLEAGVGLVQQHLFPDPALDATISENFVSGRAAGRYKVMLGKASYAQQTLEFLPNLQTSSHYRINSETALVAPISSHFGLKLGYLIKFDHAPPSASIAKTDRQLTMGVQVTY